MSWSQIQYEHNMGIFWVIRIFLVYLLNFWQRGKFPLRPNPSGSRMDPKTHSIVPQRAAKTAATKRSVKVWCSTTGPVEIIVPSGAPAPPWSNHKNKLAAHGICSRADKYLGSGMPLFACCFMIAGLPTKGGWGRQRGQSSLLNQ